MENHPDIQELIGYFDFSICWDRHGEISSHISGCGFCKCQLERIGLVHPTLKELKDFLNRTIIGKRKVQRIGIHLQSVSCMLCNRWMARLRRRKERGRERLDEFSNLELEFSSQMKMLSTLPFVANATYKRCLSRVFLSEKEARVVSTQLPTGLQVKFIINSEWENSVMEFVFFGEQGIPLIGGFVMFWGVSLGKGYYQSVISIPEEAMSHMERMECVVEIYPFGIDELSAKDGDGPNVFWSTLVADPSTYCGWYDFCKKIEAMGDADLSFWAKKSMSVINNGGER